MIYGCIYSGGLCKWNDLTLYNRDGTQYNCVQLNHGTNLTELFKAKWEGYEYGYSIELYTPPGSFISSAATDNSAQIVYEEIREAVYPGQETVIVLSKTNQTVFGLQYSQCNETQDYRLVNCIYECYNKAMTDLYGCPYPAGCVDSSGWTQ